MGIFEKASFYIEVTDQIFEGYSDGDTWNGFACPRFEYDEAVNVLKAMEESRGPSQMQRWIFDSDTREFHVFFHDSPDAPEIYGATTIFVGERRIEAYPLGAYAWIWSQLE